MNFGKTLIRKVIPYFPLPLFPYSLYSREYWFIDNLKPPWLKQLGESANVLL